MGFPLLLLLLLLTLLFLLLQPFFSIANLHKFDTLLKSNLSEQVKVIHKLDDESPREFFEVKKPIKVPNTQPCTHQILQHKFGYTSDKKYINGQPIVYAAYDPPPKENCPSQDFSKIVLEWTATCKAQQFGKVFAVWLGGVELLRGCTAEPVPNEPNGIIWTVKKDVTKYYSLLTKKATQILIVHLDNIIDKTYIGVYDVTITIHFYPVQDTTSNTAVMAGYADLILPVSDNVLGNKGLWFHIDKDTQVRYSKDIKIPQNVYKAVLEVFVSFHYDDEQWYANLPQYYLDANKITNLPGNGPFREVLIRIDDGQIVGVVWPFTVIYTGDVNPLMWKPITGIGSFDLPSYDIDITHYLGTMLDGGMHKISFEVTNALNFWFVDANLHLWRDHNREKTKVMLSGHDVSNLTLSYSEPNFKGLNGKFVTKAKRSIFSSGSVESANGVMISSNLTHTFEYVNSITMANDGNSRKVVQFTNLNQEAYTEIPNSNAPHITGYEKEFEISLETKNIVVDAYQDTYSSQSKLDLSIKEEIFMGNDQSSLQNRQIATGDMLMKDDNIFVKGSGNTLQEYSIHDFDSCYSRKVHIENYHIHYDQEGVECKLKH